MGTKLIEEGANGTHLGWNWNVIGADEIDGEELWKVSVENEQVRNNCFGHARITMWFSEDSHGRLDKMWMFTFQVTKGQRLVVLI